MRKPLLLLLLWLVNVGVRAEEHHARPLSPQLVDARAQASQLFAELDAQDQYRQSLTYDDLMVLPVGLKRNIGNSTVELAISKAIFKADRAELTVYIRLRMPAPSSNGGAAERTLFFGADQIGLTRNGGLSGQFRALLLGDFALPFEQLTVVFKGGNGLAPNGQVSDDLAQTYAVFNCQTGFERAKLSADVLFSQKMLVPLNPLTFSVDANRPVVGSFSIETSAGLHDIIGTMNFNSPFAIKGFEKLGFIVQNVVFDFSDLTNAPTLSPAAFPVGYVARNAPPGDVAYKTWRGIYAQNVALVLPAEFKRKGTTGRKIAVGASNLLIDQNGVSGRFQVTNAIALDSGRADNWRMSLTQFAVDIQENQLVGGQLAGRLQLPITNPNDSSQALAFAGRIERGGNYQLAVAAVSNLQFDLWKAKANLLAGSYVELKVVNGAFLPKAVLSGSLGISTTPSGTADTLNSKNLVRFAGVSFQNLTIQSVSPRLSADYFGYQGNCRYLGLPLVVERAGVSFGRGPLGRGSSDTTAYDKATLYFAASINLMREAVSAKTAVRIASYFDPQTETWRFERIFVDELGISAQTANFTIAGRVSQFSNRDGNKNSCGT